MPRAKRRMQHCQITHKATTYMHLLKLDPRSFIRRRIAATTNGATIAYTDTANRISRSLKVIKSRREQTSTSVTVMRTDTKTSSGRKEFSNRGGREIADGQERDRHADRMDQSVG
jgi:hypothetical protein